MYYCQMGIRYMRNEAQDMATNPTKKEPVSKFFLTTALDLMKLTEQEWELELSWVQHLRERVITRMNENERNTTEENNA